MSKFLVLLSVLVLLVPTPALAYLDPGTGSLLLQGLIAVVAGSAAAIRLNWYRLKKWVGIERRGEVDEGRSEDE